MADEKKAVPNANEDQEKQENQQKVKEPSALSKWWSDRPRIIKNPKVRKGVKIGGGIGLGLLGLGGAWLLGHHFGVEPEEVVPELTDANPVPIDVPFEDITDSVAEVSETL